MPRDRTGNRRFCLLYTSLGRESGYLFVSHVDALAGQPHVLDEQGYLDAAAQGEELYKRIEFVLSLIHI